jgi:hypothetical protein
MRAILSVLADHLPPHNTLYLAVVVNRGLTLSGNVKEIEGEEEEEEVEEA